MSLKIGIVNYEMGNIASVKNAIEFIGHNPTIISDTSELDFCDKIILPGVGAFPNAMENLRRLGFIDKLYENVFLKKKPIIGLCLGMQLLFDKSEEHGSHFGLGWVKGSVNDLKKEVDLNVPHIGWESISKQKNSRLFEGIKDGDMDFYFVHGYYCKCDDASDILATVDYGVKMDVMIEKDNIFGCQFHPEKSQKSGLKILKNFCEL